MQAAETLERTAALPTGVMRHYPLEHRAGLQSVPIHKGAKLHDVIMKNGAPHIVASAEENAEMILRDFVLLAAGEPIPADHPYLGTIESPIGSDKPHLHVLPCPEP